MLAYNQAILLLSVDDLYAAGDFYTEGAKVAWFNDPDGNMLSLTDVGK